MSPSVFTTSAFILRRATSASETILAENTVEDSAIDVEEDLNSMETEETND